MSAPEHVHKGEIFPRTFYTTKPSLVGIRKRKQGSLTPNFNEIKTDGLDITTKK